MCFEKVCKIDVLKNVCHNLDVLVPFYGDVKRHHYNRMHWNINSNTVTLIVYLYVERVVWLLISFKDHACINEMSSKNAGIDNAKLDKWIL